MKKVFFLSRIHNVEVATIQTYLLFGAFFFRRCDVVAAVFSDGTQHTDAHLVRTTEQLQAFLVLGADFPVQVACLIHQFVSLEGG